MSQENKTTFVEGLIIREYVNKSGWLNGSLKIKPKPKLSNDEKKIMKILLFWIQRIIAMVKNL